VCFAQLARVYTQAHSREGLSGPEDERAQSCFDCDCSRSVCDVAACRKRSRCKTYRDCWHTHHSPASLMPKFLRLSNNANHNHVDKFTSTLACAAPDVAHQLTAACEGCNWLRRLTHVSRHVVRAGVTAVRNGTRPQHFVALAVVSDYADSWLRREMRDVWYTKHGGRAQFEALTHCKVVFLLGRNPVVVEDGTGALWQWGVLNVLQVLTDLYMQSAADVDSWWWRPRWPR
jgi:hypothetical protein